MVSQPTTSDEAIKILVTCYKLRVRQRFGQQELEHRIPEHEGILAVVESELETSHSAYFLDSALGKNVKQSSD